MKTFKKYHDAFMFVYLPILAVLCVTAAIAPELLNLLFYLNGIFLLTLVFFLISPLKKYHQKIQTSSLKSYFGAFIKISLLQLTLIFIAVNINLVFSTLLPTGATPSPAKILTQDMQHFLTWGLFPWSAILSVGLTLTIYRITMHKDITIRQLTHPVIGKQKNKFLDVGIELFLRQGMLIAASVIIIIFALSIYFYAAALGASRIQFKPSGFTIIMYLLIFSAISSRFWKGQIKRLWLRNVSTIQIFLLQSILIILAIIILTPILSWFGNTIQVDLSQSFDFPMPHLDYNYAWTLLDWSFWMAAVVVLAPMIANIAKNKNLRVIIILSLIWPLLLALAWLNPEAKTYLTHCFLFLERPEIGLVMNLLMLIGTAFYIGFNKSFENLLMRYFYQEKAEKQKRYPLKMLTNLLKLMTLLLLLYVFTGINLLSLLLFGIIGTCYPIYAASGLGLLRELWLKRI